MSWKVTLIALRDTDLDRLAGAGWVSDGPAVYAEEAVDRALDRAEEFDPDRPASSPLYACRIRDSVLLIDGPVSEHLMADVDRRLARELGCEVVVASFMGTVDSYWWRVTGPGIDREWMRSTDDVVHDSGEPLPEEAGIDELDEDSLFDLFRARTGIVTDDWLEAQVVPLRNTTDAADSGSGGLLSRIRNLFGGGSGRD